MLFRMGGTGRCDVSNQSNYFRLACKLRNILFGILRLRARGGWAQVYPDQQRWGVVRGMEGRRRPQGGAQSSQDSGW